MDEERIAERVREIFQYYESYKFALQKPELVQALIDYAIELYWQTTEGGE